jgi:hypothetical protein
MTCAAGFFLELHFCLGGAFVLRGCLRTASSFVGMSPVLGISRHLRGGVA